MKILVIAILCLWSHAVYAASGYSAYSIFGLGDLRFSTGARSAAMGFTGVASTNPLHTHAMAPATWSRINRTRIELGFYHDRFSSTDGTTSRKASATIFDGLTLTVPISPANGVVLSGGFVPYSNVDYVISSRGSQNGVDYTYRQQGDGGLTMAVMGVAYAPSKNLSLGVAFNYLFGRIESQRTLDSVARTPDPTADTLAGGTATSRFSFRGPGITAGFVFNGFGSLAGALEGFSLGLSATSRLTLKPSLDATFEYAGERDTLRLSSSNFAIPIAYAAGLGYQKGRYTILTEYTAQPWSKADAGDFNPRYIDDSYRIGIGFERVASTDQFASWLDRITYRLGFHTGSTYISVDNESIHQWGVTGGFGFTISGETLLNLALEYGKRGTTTNGLVEDTIIRVTASLSFNEQWFIQYEPED